MFWAIVIFSFPVWFGAIMVSIARARENKAIREGRPEDAYINILGKDHRKSKLGIFLAVILFGHHNK